MTYAASKPGLIFPHDSTNDQWFSEGQFAAYTQLGRIMANEVLKCWNDPTTYDTKTYDDPPDSDSD